MHDALNQGLPTDRFDVDWWVLSHRVNRRLSRRRRTDLTLAHFLAGGAQIVNPAEMDLNHLPHPVENPPVQVGKDLTFLLVEIPFDFQALKVGDIKLALDWRLHTRTIFESLFAAGYLVTDFVQSISPPTRSYYVLVHGESTL
jgi:predicted GNAT superfamily acetyltransferase